MAADPSRPAEPPPSSDSPALRLLAPALVLALGGVGLVAGLRLYRATPPPVAAPAAAPAAPDPNRFDLDRLLAELVTAERTVGPQVDQAIEAFRAQGLDEAQLNRKISSNILPPFSAARDELKYIPVKLPAPEDQRVKRALEYANLRGELWLLMVRRAIQPGERALLLPEEREKLAAARSAAGLDKF